MNNKAEREYKVSFNSEVEKKVNNILYDFFRNKYSRTDDNSSFIVKAKIEDIEYYLTFLPQVARNISIEPVEE